MLTTLVFSLAIALPICTIAAFIIGYNVNATKKIFQRKKKHVDTADEKLLKHIDSLTVDDF